MKKRPNMTSAALKKLDCGIRGQKLTAKNTAKIGLNFCKLTFLADK